MSVLSDVEIEAIDAGMCGEREFAIEFGRRVAEAAVAAYRDVKSERNYIAAKAMSALLISDNDYAAVPHLLAIEAYRITDAMLAAANAPSQDEGGTA